MWQPIPVYGDAVFQYRAGEHQRFFLTPNRRTMSKGKAMLISAAPAWDPERPAVQLGTVPVSSSQQPVYLCSQQATRLLHELYTGSSPEFSRMAWYADDRNITVALSSVNFRKAYSQYRQCLAQLLPVNFDQIARSRIHFVTAKWEITAKASQRLDLIITYVNADPSITGFFIDGHTDDVGRRLYNLDLSKKRAEAVNKYLIAKGIDESLITTRYHGERYPVAKNSSAKNRSQNRRVTIRLDREGV